MGCKHLIGEARKTMFLGNVYTNIDFSQNIFSKFTARGTLRGKVARLALGAASMATTVAWTRTRASPCLGATTGSERAVTG